MDCRWSPIVWEPCNKTCGGGSQSGVRSMEQEAENGGTDCVGDTVVSRSCNIHDCPVEDCRWSPIFWGPCNETCGGGSQSGVRWMEQEAENGGSNCTGDTVVSRSCNQHNCPITPVDCAWDQWSTWTTCSRSCGSGTKVRRRNVSTWPLHGGLPCPGVASELEQCNNDPCPSVNCEWSEWEEWFSCSETCGKGIRDTNQ